MSPLIITFSFIFGAILGSFFHVLVLRLHSGKGGIISGRSECPHCSHKLGAADLIPLFSYLVLRGKCRYCKKKISWNYFLIELITGATFAYSAYYFLPQLEFNVTWYALMLLVYWFYLSVLIIITFYDLYFGIIPDGISLPAIIVAFALSTLPFTVGFIDGVLGALIPFTFFALQIIISQGRWIGGGDLRLALFMGAILGPASVVVALFAGYLSGALIGVGLIASGAKGAKSKIPFGPFLCFGTFIALFWGPKLIEIYWNFVIGF